MWEKKEKAGNSATNPPVKRKRGRPRKKPISDASAIELEQRKFFRNLQLLSNSGKLRKLGFEGDGIIAMTLYSFRVQGNHGKSANVDLPSAVQKAREAEEKDRHRDVHAERNREGKLLQKSEFGD